MIPDIAELNDLTADLIERPLCVAQLNVQRMSNIDKFHDIITLFNHLNTKPDVLIFTETWILKGTEAIYNIPGYEAYHACRDTHSAGVALYFKSGLKCDLISSANDEVSFIHASVSQANGTTGKLLLTAIYMPNSNNFPLLCSRLHDILPEVACDHLLMGDFNVNVNHNGQMSTTYLDILAAQGYSIKNTFVTRPASGTIIDHVITNFDDTICVTFQNSVSDHNGTIILFDSPVDCANRGYTTIRRIKTDFDGVKTSMNDACVTGSNAEERFTNFHKSLTEAMKANTQESFLKVKNNNPFASTWVTEALLKLSKRKHRLLSQRDPSIYNPSLRRRIEEVSQKVKDLKELLRDKDTQSKFGPSVRLRTKWRNLNELIGRKRKPTAIQKIVKTDGTSITEPLDIANAFNEHFVNTPCNIPRHSPSNRSPKSIFFRTTDAEEVAKLIRNMKKKKSVGWDCVSTALLMNCAPVLAPLLAPLFNQCFHEGYYPKELKIARIIPIFKKGESYLLGNYRPIALLSVINKIFERLIYLRLLEFFNRQKFLYKRQYGFRQRSNTSNCAMDVLERIYKGLDVSEAVTALFLDLSKAFDLVDHKLLLAKLEAQGIRGMVLDFLVSYFSNRTQYVDINGSCSSRLSVDRGVVQGSLLGPLFFLVYINEIANLELNGQSFLFADDTTIVYSSESYATNCTTAEADLRTLSAFLEENGLQLNAGKTKVMHFTTSRRGNIPDTVKFNGDEIETVKSFKYLGLLLDSQLTWKDHIEHVLAKTRGVVAILRKAKRIIPRDVRKLLYFTMFHPHLIYMIELWGAACTIHLKRVQVLQNAAIRNILDLPSLTPRLNLFTNRNLSVLPVKALYERALTCFVYKRRNNMILSEIEFHCATHDYNSRSRGRLRTPKCRLSTSMNRISFAAAVAFNKLEIPIASNLGQFKKLSYSFYSSNVVSFLNY